MIRERVGRGLATVWASALIALIPAGVAAHAFPERSEPRVGSTLHAAPARVLIWFDGDLEPAFSSLSVTSAAGQRVDHGKGGVEPANRRLLQTGLQPLPPGTYRVHWRVLSVDGHTTQGDFTFTVAP